MNFNRIAIFVFALLIAFSVDVANANSQQRKKASHSKIVVKRIIKRITKQVRKKRKKPIHPIKKWNRGVSKRFYYPL